MKLKVATTLCLLASMMFVAMSFPVQASMPGPEQKPLVISALERTVTTFVTHSRELFAPTKNVVPLSAVWGMNNVSPFRNPRLLYVSVDPDRVHVCHHGMEMRKTRTGGFACACGCDTGNCDRNSGCITDSSLRKLARK